MGNSHNWAETQMRQAVVVRRMAWPAGKVAFYDIDNDGTPDKIVEWDKAVFTHGVRELSFIEREMMLYEGFRQYVRLSIDGVVDPGLFITQEDSLANDWVAA